jgi:hypothetical protein
LRQFSSLRESHIEKSWERGTRRWRLLITKHTLALATLSLNPASTFSLVPVTPYLYTGQARMENHSVSYRDEDELPEDKEDYAYIAGCHDDEGGAFSAKD